MKSKHYNVRVLINSAAMGQHSTKEHDAASTDSPYSRRKVEQSGSIASMEWKSNALSMFITRFFKGNNTSKDTRKKSVRTHHKKWSSHNKNSASHTCRMVVQSYEGDQKSNATHKMLTLPISERNLSTPRSDPYNLSHPESSMLNSKRAVLVSIGHGELTQIHSSRDELLMTKSYLVKSHRFKPFNIILLTNIHGISGSKPATHFSIMNALDNLMNISVAGDTALFYFVGLRDSNGSIVPSDSHLHGSITFEMLHETLIRSDQLNKVFLTSMIKDAKKILIKTSEHKHESH
mmetsp:Transcript_16852/g.20578  ORF Transcript_16852/g.20578 Transcript_16852/m.20578 type:complete len:291 (-) Transcript_16852:505-1377(-)